MNVLEILEMLGLSDDQQVVNRMCLPRGTSYREHWEAGALAALRAREAWGREPCWMHGDGKLDRNQCLDCLAELKVALEEAK